MESGTPLRPERVICNGRQQLLRCLDVVGVAREVNPAPRRKGPIVFRVWSLWKFMIVCRTLPFAWPVSMKARTQHNETKAKDHQHFDKSIQSRTFWHRPCLS